MIPGRIRPTTDNSASLPHCEISPYLACRALLERDLVSLLCHRRRVLPGGNRGNDFIHSLCRGILRILPAAGPPGGAPPAVVEIRLSPVSVPAGHRHDGRPAELRLRLRHVPVQHSFDLLLAQLERSLGSGRFPFRQTPVYPGVLPGGGVSPGPGGAVLQL